MLDNLIKQKTEQISYNKAELKNIAKSSNHLREIIKNQPDYRSSFIGGSYKRGTLVKGISDIDIYYEYTGEGNPQTALTRLKSCLLQAYPNSEIKQDKPSILVDFQRIPFNITPFKIYSGNKNIPSNNLRTWQQINLESLEKSVKKLREKNTDYIFLIKIIKFWNIKRGIGLKNFKIEQNICNFFLSQNYTRNKNISDWMWEFYMNIGHKKDADIIFSLMKNNYNSQELKNQWLNFIENR
ncbi:MAG: nucleotidyltransferase [Chlorobi bacterium]|nr:nucleotidyltransferase [Chlorobiota bacterium]